MLTHAFEISPGHKSTRKGAGYWDGEGETESQSRDVTDAPLGTAGAGS